MATDNDFRMWEQELGRIDEHDEAAISELFEAVGGHALAAGCR